jgi:hypothetical protein
MLHIETVTIRGEQLQRVYSDTYRILQIETGVIYDDATDVLACRYTYTETSILLDEIGP